MKYANVTVGNIISIMDWTGGTFFGYDTDNRETLKTLPGGTPIASTYDPVGNLLTLTDSGGTTTYHYNAVNLSDALTEPGGAQTTFSYDANNNKTGVNYPNKVSMALTYDGGGRETIIVATTGAGTTLMAVYTQLWLDNEAE